MNPVNQVSEAMDGCRRAPKKPWPRRIVNLLGSLKLAVPLLALLGIVIAAATVLEADYGRAYAHWYVYHSWWFAALLGLLGLNIFFAAVSRWPWKRHQTGFVVTHGGLLVLLTGSVVSVMGGIEGNITLAEGESATHLTIPQQSQIVASWMGRPTEAPYEFSFENSPVDWKEGHSLDLGAIDGIGARVLHYYRHARAIEEWVSDPSGTGGPMIKLQIEAPFSNGSADYTLVDQDYGDEAYAGPIRLQLERAANDRMLDDFLEPPTENLGQKGLLSAYYAGGVKHIPVDANMGKRINLDADGTAVEIDRCLPNAQPDAHGHFRSLDQQPRNPLLELQVYLPQKRQIRQLAFAKNPLLNLDPVLGQACPIKFRYQHPAIKPPASVEFLQTGDARLYYRVIAEGRPVSKGELHAGSNIPTSGKFTIALADYVPHAQQKLVFEPLDVDADQKEKPEPAAEVAVSAGGITQQVWLQRNHPTYGSRLITTPQGTLQVRFGYGEAPLGFALQLVQFHRNRNPGGVGNAAFSSDVRVIDKRRGVDDEWEVSMNQPLTYNGLTFYQSGFNDGGDPVGQGAKSSTFSVARDPGRRLKYAGSLLICVGIAIMFYMRAYFFKRSPRRVRISGVETVLDEGRRQGTAELASAAALGSPSQPIQDRLATAAAAESGPGDQEAL
jgi:hypothetical protein